MSTNALRRLSRDEFRARYYDFKQHIEDAINDPAAPRGADLGWLAPHDVAAWTPADHMRILHFRDDHHLSPIGIVDVSHGIRDRDSYKKVSEVIASLHWERSHKHKHAISCGIKQPKPRKPYLPTWATLESMLTDAEKASRIEPATALSSDFAEYLQANNLTYHDYLDNLEAKHKAEDGLVEVDPKTRLRKGNRGMFLLPQVHYLKQHQPLDAADYLLHQSDTYMSMNLFRLWRKTENWAALGCLFVDQDDPEKNHGMSQEELVHHDLAIFAACGIPAPSYVMGTGVGIAPVWLHEYCHRPKDAERVGALPKWQLAMKCLQEIFEHFDLKPDNKAKDVTRVMRIAGTINSKNNNYVRPLYIHDRDQEGTPSGLWSPVEYKFSELAQRIIDVRIELLGPIPQKSRKSPAKLVEGAEIVSFAAEKAKAKKPAKGYYSAILGDVYKLIESRKNFDNLRDYMLFTATVALCHVTAADAVVEEVKRLAARVGMEEDDAVRQMGSAIRRAQSSTSENDQRYKICAATMVRNLKITVEEMRGLDLRAMINSEVRSERDRLRKAKERGQVKVPEPKEVMAAQAQQRAQRASELSATGKSIREIAEIMEMPKSTVGRLLKKAS